MAGWRIGKELGTAITALLFLVSCSASPVDGRDSGPDSVELDATGDASGADDVLDAGDIWTDVFQDANRPDDAIADEIQDAADGIQDAVDEPGDATTEILVCGDVPKEGCPCDKSTDEPCCLMPGKGLSCSGRMVNGVVTVTWNIFWDCGCIEGPPCEGWEIYPICPIR